MTRKEIVKTIMDSAMETMSSTRRQAIERIVVFLREIYQKAHPDHGESGAEDFVKAVLVGMSTYNDAEVPMTITGQKALAIRMYEKIINLELE